MSSGCLTENEVLSLVAGAMATVKVEEVESHLDGCLKCQLLVSAGVRTSSLRTHGFDREPAGQLHFQVGQVVSARYRITRFIARGGMGEVYAAFDEMLGEEIALKILLRSAAAGAADLVRLRAEVQLARRVLNPHVLRVFDIGSYRLAEGHGEAEAAEILYLTMQLLDGETLRARIRRAGPLAPPEVWRLASDMLAALGAAHQLGIVHRDFKSDNVMLVPNAGGSPQAVVMDFGLAQAVATNAPLREVESPLVAGTLGYMAPEQLSGRAVTAAADVYAFGVVLYEMLTGVLPPFRPKVGRRPAHEQPPPPLPLDTLDIPARWRRVIRRCLARDPVVRFRNMIEVRQALVGRRGLNPRVFFMAAATAGALAAAAGVMLWKHTPAAAVVSETEARVSSSPAPAALVHAPREPLRPAPAHDQPAEVARSRRRRASASGRAGGVPAPVKRVSEATEVVQTTRARGRSASPAPAVDGDDAIDPFAETR